MSKPQLRPGDDRDILAAKFEIESEQVLHFKNLYKLMHEWLGEKGYVDPEGMTDKFESFYFERTIASTGNQEHRIWWRAHYIPGNSNYVRYFLKVDFQTLNAKSVEVMHKGLKFKTNKIDAIVRIEAWLQLDYNNLWKDHWLLKHVDNFFRKRIYKNFREEHKRELYRHAYEFQQRIKQYLNIKTFEPQPKLFQHRLGM
ncbi:MAG: hypothetical protein ABIC91_04120 [Nanoarchaeota archaeon]|nr:hypothetical protein [Nanoarchaeota archaeon]MBU1031272.1 hypothetical protein [Nanoarchaeota archaeon]MBU1850201.1 hypothetical protein [Nanoarchaeota archaeon]